ncbi:hypothetical protein BMT55_03915 [Listeria newyorkensis]|uniref:Uncharacterized protein n=1 Tax=Listeria newyorkensis TaxID=1497681 RepID=A0ABX4XQS6_9LIST|nr:hypothetical protein [Listeria newyorkensis]KGL41961.1 hypothetical protein EP58_10500 [Listeria newyorkensis]PNP93923.1 hypothetical protein BMT55_03915 [Listeria newyorkensis]WAO22549.2 hypothetical protein OTR81_04545 [Listeria newyorkensis]SQC51198.1 Uncharacterised protein [Listeria newyorkensis]
MKLTTKFAAITICTIGLSGIMIPQTSASSTENMVSEATSAKATPKIKNAFHPLLASDIAL